jgi:hypothetical protein
MSRLLGPSGQLGGSELTGPCRLLAVTEYPAPVNTCRTILQAARAAVTRLCNP